MTFLYDLPDWPHFRVDHSLFRLTTAIARQQSFLSGRIMEGTAWHAVTWNDNTRAGYHAEAADKPSAGAFIDDILEAVNSNTTRILIEDAIDTSAIEGETLTWASVRYSVRRQLGLDTGLANPEDRKIEGLVEMLLDATRNCHQPLTEQRLWRWHGGLFPDGIKDAKTIRGRGEDEAIVGGWRKGDMYIWADKGIGRETIEYTAPSAGRVEAEMTAFLQWFNTPDTGATSEFDPLVKAAVAHLYFILIHPFDDGNGRIARALTDMLLARSDALPGRFYSLSSQIKLDRRAYYRALHSSQDATMDITAWCQWFLECLGRALTAANHSIDRVMQKSRIWVMLGGININERQRLMIDKLCAGFKGNLTSQKWASITKTTQITAIRDIDSLVKHGVLTKQKGGRSTNYALFDPQMIVRAATEISSDAQKPLPDQRVDRTKEGDREL